MNSEQLQNYRDLLIKYQAYVLFHGKTDSDIQKIKDDVETLSTQDPEFEELLGEIELEYSIRSVNKKFLSRMVYDLSKKVILRKTVEFNNNDLVWFVDLYHHDPQFRSTCDAHKVLYNAIPSWLDEYYQRFTNDDRFAMQVFERKLGRYALGQLGLEDPVEFHENERMLLVRLYYKYPEFQILCDNHNVIVREMIASWLKER